MALQFLGSTNTSQGGGCPAFYRDTETGNIVVQGDQLTDPALLSQLRDVKEGETFVVVPSALFDYAPREERA